MIIINDILVTAASHENVLFAKTVIWSIEDKDLSLVGERERGRNWINIDDNSYK